MELKLTQELSSIDQDPLFLVFLDLWNAYNNVDRERLIITLEGYGSGPHMCSLLETFWECQQVVLRQNGFHGPAFPATRGTMQGGIFSPTLFNVLVDNIIRTWLVMTVEDHRVAHDILEETVGRCLGLFYANNDMVGSRDLDWLQNAINILVGLVRRYVLDSNVENSSTII